MKKNNFKAACLVSLTTLILAGITPPPHWLKAQRSL